MPKGPHAFSALGFGVLCDNLYRFRIGRRFGRRRLVLAFVAPTVLVATEPAQQMGVLHH